MTSAIRLYCTYILSTFVPLNTIRRVFELFTPLFQKQILVPNFGQKSDLVGLEPKKRDFSKFSSIKFCLI